MREEERAPRETNKARTQQHNQLNLRLLIGNFKEINKLIIQLKTLMKRPGTLTLKLLITKSVSRLIHSLLADFFHSIVMA